MKISKGRQKTLKKLMYLPLVFIVLTLVDSSHNLEFTRIVGSISSKSHLDKCQVHVEVKRNWPFSFAPKSAKLIVKSDSIEFETYISRYKLPDRKFLKNHNTEYRFIWDDSIMAIEVTPKFKLDKLSIENCSEDECAYTDHVLSCAV